MRTPLAGLALALLATAPPARAQLPTIAAYTQGFEKRDGYFPLYWDAAKARLLLEVDNPGEEFLYLPSLATGMGDVNLPLDRGTIGQSELGKFDRQGNQILLVLENPQFRAVTDNAALRRSVEESFPTSTVGAFEVLAEENGHVLVDVTPFVIGDVMQVLAALRNQGGYRLDRDRSTIYQPHTKAFPRNTEIEVSLTFASDNPGRQVEAHAPDGRAVTLREHYSFVKLPDPGFTPRRFDPRLGIFSLAFFDFAKPLDQDPVTRYTIRHRLIKKNPGAALSDPVQPIVYYLDAGVPEPYRSAFRDGAMWWNKVFEAAGFSNAFQVRDMPPDMDPMDARYNVIQWVHRDEAGYSIGPAFVDPRTGEIIKAAVRMEVNRSFTDYNIYAGTIPGLSGDEPEDPFLSDPSLSDWLASFDSTVTPEQFAMARRRQHAAHEVGHTLGLAHNFTAAAQGRASVMAYPAPLIKLTNGHIDLSEAYRNGPGAWDSLALRYNYTEFPAGQQEAGIAAIAREAQAKGMKFITNPDESPGGSYPEATVWVNGADAVEDLARVQQVRDFLVNRFDQRAIHPGEPQALLVRRFTSVYLHHLFTLGADVKAIGGMEFRYGVRGDSAPPTTLIPAARQRRALDLALHAIQPAELAVPERVLALMAPTPFGYDRDSWALESKAAPAFDQLGAARVIASQVVGGILDPARAARLAAFADRDPSLPTLTEVIGKLIDRTWGAPAPAQHAALQRVTERVVVDELIRLAGNADAVPEARAAAEWGLRRIQRQLAGPASPNPEAQAQRALAAADIDRFLSRRDAAAAPAKSPEAPPSTPIGH